MYIIFALSNNLAYPKNNEDSGKAETNPYPHDADKASIKDDKKCQIEIIISRLADKTKQAHRALETNKKGQIQDKELIKSSEDVLLCKRNGSEVTAENGAGRYADQGAETG